MGSSALRICICIKYASPKLQAGHTAMVLSTFSHALAPPNISSTFLRLGGYDFCTWGDVIGWEYGHVVHAKMCLEDDSCGAVVEDEEEVVI